MINPAAERCGISPANVIANRIIFDETGIFVVTVNSFVRYLGRDRLIFIIQTTHDLHQSNITYKITSFEYSSSESVIWLESSL